MKINVEGSIVPHAVINDYLKTYEKDSALLEEIISTSKLIKATIGCDEPSGDVRANVHVVVGPQAVGKSGVVRRISEDYQRPVIIDRYDYIQQLPSFQQARMHVQEGFDGNVGNLHKSLEAVTRQYLAAALWIENDVITCAVRNNRTVLVETSGTNTLKFINRLEQAGAEVSVHACIAPLVVIQDAAVERYRNNPDYAISDNQIEQEYNRLIEILPKLCAHTGSVAIYTRQGSKKPLEEAIYGDASYMEQNDYHVGILDGILGNHRLSAQVLLPPRKPVSVVQAFQAETAPAPAL